MTTTRSGRTIRPPQRLREAESAFDEEFQRVEDEISELRASLAATSTPVVVRLTPLHTSVSQEEALERERVALLEEIRTLELAKEVESLRRRKDNLLVQSDARSGGVVTPLPKTANPVADSQHLAKNISPDVQHLAAEPTIQDQRRDQASAAEIEKSSPLPKTANPVADSQHLPAKKTAPDLQHFATEPAILRRDQASVTEINRILGDLNLTSGGRPSASASPRAYGKKISGFFRTPRSSSRITKHVIWPQELLPAFSTESAKLTYDMLTYDQFIAGYMRLFNSDLLQLVELSERLKLVQKCAEYTLRYPWDSVRDYHGEVMRAVEEGQFDWGDSDYNTHVEEMFKMYVQPFLQSSTPARRVQSLSQLQQTIKYCKLFQSRSCPQAELIHDDVQFGEVHHVCATCLTRHDTAAYNHGSSDCSRKGDRDRRGTGTSTGIAPSKQA
ncbi:Hypp6505 [Branchiostoma lanceolatum]|uniref:Hypp6505 protein n=1 Tax=Branchiostoma lanceolatum TaxID=7740 RepID=A0A8J9YUX6_BRALA|nr:Hypp6505 [Branchiostoma lanceolatum]